MSQPDGQVDATQRWANETCAILEEAVLQPETVGVAPGDLSAFFRGAAVDSEEVSQKLSELEPALGTESYMRNGVETFGRLAPILDETATQLEEATGGLETPAPESVIEMRLAMALQEERINELLAGFTRAHASLPAVARTVLGRISDCGTFRGVR